MLDASTRTEAVKHAGFAPGEFPPEWYDSAYGHHCRAWPTPWEGRLDKDRFVAELDSDHVDVLFENDGSTGNGALLAYLKWKATDDFYLSRDRLSDPSFPSLSPGPSARFACAYEITATTEGLWRGLGRRLLSETIAHWERWYSHAVFCTYSPKRGLTSALRRLAQTRQHDRPALEAFVHRASAAASRHIDKWVERLGQPLDAFITREIVPIPDEQIMTHLATLGERYGQDVIEGVIAAMGIAYNYVLRASSGLPVCGPTAFHRTLGAEHWRQCPGSASNCADALGLVDHWRYSHDPARREKCAKMFKQFRLARVQRGACPDQLIVLA